MTHPPNPADARIDHVLNALRAIEAPTGLEQRVAARLAHPSEARTTAHPPFAATASHAAPSFFAVILNAVKDPRIFLAPPTRYALAATSLVAMLAALSLFALHAHHQTSATSPISASVLPLQPSAQDRSTPAPFDSGSLQSRSNTPIANTPAPQGFSLGSLIPPKTAEPSTPPPTDPDPDAIALAETLAPSRPAPPEPLTQQELLTLAVLRSGNPEGIAALDPTKRDALLAQNELAFQNFFAPPKSEPPTPPTTTGAKE